MPIRRLGGDVRTLNLPAVRNLDCTPSCTWERTLRNTLEDPSDWTVTGDNFGADYDIDISPSTFSFTGDTSETVTLTITVTPQADLSGSINFGSIDFIEDSGQAPDQHFTVAIRGTDLSAQEINVDPTSFE
jgi:hypothetical protein